MIEVVAALIWDGERFLICQRPEPKARGVLLKYVEIGSPKSPCFLGKGGVA